MIFPYDLTCQRVQTPLGIAEAPTFSWKLQSDERNQFQTAYRLCAASSEEMLEAPDLFDSGKIISDRSLDVTWMLAPLPAFTRVYWNVTVWDRADIPATSKTIWFETGVSPELFLGKTIFAGPSPDKPYEKTSFATTAPALDLPVLPFTSEAEALMHSDVPPPEHELPKVMRGGQEKQEFYIRKSFSCTGVPTRARLYLTASGPCLVRLNGQPAGPWLHDPSPNACSYRSLYTPYDITEKLQPGVNVLGISSPGANLTAVFMAEYADGHRDVFTTDTTWRWTLGPTICTGSSEAYDARAELSGWDCPNFDDSGWNFCGTGPDPLIEVHPNLMPVQRVVWREHPAVVERTPWGTYRCKASRISAGHV